MKANLSRRKFLGNASLAVGAIGLPIGMGAAPHIPKVLNAHHVMIGTVSLMNLAAKRNA